MGKEKRTERRKSCRVEDGDGGVLWRVERVERKRVRHACA